MTAGRRARVLLSPAVAGGGARREAADERVRGVELRRREPRGGAARQAQGHRLPEVNGIGIIYWLFVQGIITGSYHMHRKSVQTKYYEASENVPQVQLIDFTHLYIHKSGLRGKQLIK